MENSTFVSDGEIQEYVEQSLGDYLDVVIEAGGGELYTRRTPDTVNPTVAGQETYVIAQALTPQLVYANIYRILQVQVQDSGGKWRRIRPIRAHELVMREDEGGSWSDLENVRYYLSFPNQEDPSGSSYNIGISFYPVPDGVNYFRVVYVAYPIDWSADDTYVIQGLSGWDEFIVCDAAAKCLEKEESDASHLYARVGRAEQRIRYAARTINLDDNGKVRDIDLDTFYPEKA